MKERKSRLSKMTEGAPSDWTLDECLETYALDEARDKVEELIQQIQLFFTEIETAFFQMAQKVSPMESLFEGQQHEMSAKDVSFVKTKKEYIEVRLTKIKAALKNIQTVVNAGGIPPSDALNNFTEKVERNVSNINFELKDIKWINKLQSGNSGYREIQDAYLDTKKTVEIAFALIKSIADKDTTKSVKYPNKVSFIQIK